MSFVEGKYNDAKMIYFDNLSFNLLHVSIFELHNITSNKIIFTLQIRKNIKG